MSIINDNGVHRQMTATEQKEFDAWAAIARQEQENEQNKIELIENAKTSARAKLAALGLTDTEIAALLGA